MTAPLRPVDFAAAAGCMVLSSWLGLTGRLNGGLPNEEALRFFGSVWSDSLAADAMFAGGSALAFLGAFWVLRQQRDEARWVAAILLGLGGFLVHWLVYVLSFLLLSYSDDMQAPDALSFVVNVGIVGLLWCVVVPALSLAWIRAPAPAVTPAATPRP